MNSLVINNIAMRLSDILLAVHCSVHILTAHPSLMYCILVCITHLMVWKLSGGSSRRIQTL